MNTKSKIKTLSLICFTVLISLPISVYAAPFDHSNTLFKKEHDEYKRLIGITAGVGSVKNDRQETGNSAYINAFLLWVNLSAEHQRFDTYNISNTYTGVGIGRYFQLQYGYGDEGYLLRVRSEIEVIGKLTVFVAAERYRDKREYDNVSAGIGYNF